MTSPRTVRTPGTAPETPATHANDSAARIRAYPNPASGPVTLEIHVPGTSSEPVQIRLYDTKGRWTATLADGVYAPGQSTVRWNGTSLTGQMVGAGYYDLVGRIGDTKVRDRLVVLP